MVTARPSNHSPDSSRPHSRPTNGTDADADGQKLLNSLNLTKHSALESHMKLKGKQAEMSLMFSEKSLNAEYLDMVKKELHEHPIVTTSLPAW